MTRRSLRLLIVPSNLFTILFLRRHAILNVRTRIRRIHLVDGRMSRGSLQQVGTINTEELGDLLKHLWSNVFPCLPRIGVHKASPSSSLGYADAGVKLLLRHSLFEPERLDAGNDLLSAKLAAFL